MDIGSFLDGCLDKAKILPEYMVSLGFSAISSKFIPSIDLCSRYLNELYQTLCLCLEGHAILITLVSVVITRHL